MWIGPYPVQQSYVENLSYQSVSASQQPQQYTYQNTTYQHATYQHVNYQYDCGIPSADELNQTSSQTLQNLAQCSIPIEQNFPYYRSNKKWHGTISHDLTVNDCFAKFDPRPGQKGCLWLVHHEFQDMFSSRSLRRRRHCFKEGSTSWRKAHKDSADKTHRTSKQVRDDATWKWSSPTETSSKTSSVNGSGADLSNPHTFKWDRLANFTLPPKPRLPTGPI